MKKPLIITIAVILIALAVVAYLRFVVGGDEDTWLCEDGAWVKHGNPSVAMPTSGCGTKQQACDAITTEEACRNRTDCIVVDECGCATEYERAQRCGETSEVTCDCVGGGFVRCETLQCDAGEPPRELNVTYETYMDHGPLYVFDIVKEWTAIAPEEIQKSITEEQRHGYGIVFFASNPDAVTMSVSEKTSSDLHTLAAIVADDKAQSSSNQNVTWVDERMEEGGARTELTTTSGTTAYTVFSRYLVVSSSPAETRWAMMELAVPTSRTVQYGTIISHLLDSLATS